MFHFGLVDRSRQSLMYKTNKRILLLGVAFLLPNFGLAADFPIEDKKLNMIDPTPVSVQKPAVDGLNFKAGFVTGVVGGYHNHMFLTTISAPMPFAESMGIQLDFGTGLYRKDYTSAAAGLHIFWRNPDVGLLGIYGDWGYVDNEHGGRVGIEGSLYNGNWTLDVLAAKQFGQHYLTKFVDEVDLSYYFTENFKGSIGHRLTSRGHVANFGFEYADPANSGWSIYGEAEVGEDDYDGAWVGLRYAFGSSQGKSLIDRDRQSDPLVRIPRNLSSLTRCGDGDPHKSWNGFEYSYTTNICGSAQDLADYNAVEGKLNSD